MSDYIDRDALIDSICAGCGWDGICTAKCIDLRTIRDFPAADVAPVVHAKWEWDDDGIDYNIGSWICGHCKNRPETTWDFDPNANPYKWNGSSFCSNCGAKMEETE